MYVIFRRGFLFPTWLDFKKKEQKTLMVLLLTCPQRRFSSLFCEASCSSLKWEHENCCCEFGGIIHSIPFLMGFANWVWEFIIHLVKTEHMTSCKSSDNIREKYVATQKERRVGCGKPGPMRFYSQCLLFGLGRDYHLIYFFWQFKELPNRTWRAYSCPKVISLSSAAVV